MASFGNLAARIDALALKERALMLLAVVLVLVMAWDRLLMQPLDAEERRLSAEIGERQRQVAALQAQAETIVQSHGRDPDAATRMRLEQLQAELAEVKAGMAEAARQLVAPEAMARLLETVLIRTRGLSLVALQGLGASPLLPVDDSSPAPQVGAWKHGLRLEFEGGYLEALDYLRSLEALPWGFFWNSFELQVDDYPRTRAAITVFTLSLDPSWIGV